MNQMLVLRVYRTGAVALLLHINIAQFTLIN